MKKFMVLYQSPISSKQRMAQASQEQMQASMAEWIAWRDKRGGVERIEFGMPLDVGKHIAGGTVTDSALPVTGSAVVHAESLDEAVAMLMDHPFLREEGCSVEVLEVIGMPGL